MESELVGGSGGVFEVRLDGAVVFSKGPGCGTPDPAIVVDALRQAIGAA